MRTIRYYVVGAFALLAIIGVLGATYSYGLIGAAPPKQQRSRMRVLPK
jgi:hypothetical protein